MEWEFIVALMVAIPIILFPAVFVWYINAGGMYAALKAALARRIARGEAPPEDISADVRLQGPAPHVSDDSDRPIRR